MLYCVLAFSVCMASASARISVTLQGLVHTVRCGSICCKYSSRLTVCLLDRAQACTVAFPDQSIQDLSVIKCSEAVIDTAQHARMHATMAYILKL